MKIPTASCVALSAIAASGLAFAATSEPVAYVSNEGGGVSVVSSGSHKEIGRIDAGPDPRGISITPDGRWLLTANKGSSDVSVVDLSSRKEVRRIPVGKNVEFMRVSPEGSRAFVTYEPSAKSGPKAEGRAEDDAVPAEVAVIDLERWAVVARMKAAPETEGIEFTADGKQLVVTNEGDNSLGVYDLADLRQVKRIDVSALGNRPRGIKLAPDGRSYVVTFENSNSFGVIDPEFRPVKSVPTEKGPYGVAFDRDGKTLWIAAARSDRIQVFDAARYTPIASIPVGKRCWHFSFSPDGREVLVACGRSNSVEVIDTRTYTVLQSLKGFDMPWGIVTYPKSQGSLDAAMNGAGRTGE